MGTQQTKQFPTGTRPHGDGIQIRFKEKGQKNYSHETLPWSPTPANLEKAGKLRKEICGLIKIGAFNYAQYFPNSPKANQVDIETFAHFCQKWLDRPDNDWKPQSRRKFLGILQRVWMPTLHDKKIAAITTGDLLSTLETSLAEYKKKHKDSKEPSQSTYNDWLLCVRGVFDTAVLSGQLKRQNDPTAELRNKKRIKDEPDPFDPHERDLIIADIYKHDGVMWGSWFELGFFTGMRYPSEPAAILWSKIDLRKGEIRIDQIKVRTKTQKTTKTGITRTILLNSRSRAAVNNMKEITGFKGEHLFLQKNGDPIGEGQRARIIWAASLKRLGIRHRNPYNMRHSFASWGLSKGMAPAFLAQQLGHSLEEFFRTYAKWIAKANNDLQMKLMEEAINSEKWPQSGQETALNL